jgi:Tfp pilus assembly protein PilX
MLVINRVEHRRNDEGAVLVTVVVVMLVGFIVATVIAASVLFTIRSNVGNTDRTQAFISAESGRDAALASLSGAINSAGDLVCTPAMLVDDGSDPAYTYKIRSTQVLTAAKPLSWESPDLSDACPTVNSNFVVIQAKGTAPDGSTATIDAVYPWRVTHVEQPAGTMAYFDGQFRATKSTYEGDLVIRGTAPYTCNNSSVIDGDLWVVKSSVVLSTDCTVTGSVYVFGTVDASSSGINIGGDLIAGGDINMASNGVVIGGKIHSGAKISLTNTGSTTATVVGDVIARTTATVGDKWVHPTTPPTPIVPIQDGPAPVFAPTLVDVFDVTKWLEITSPGIWGAPSSTPSTTTYTTCDPAVIRTELANASAGRALFDMSACLTPSKKTVNVHLEGAAISVARDAVFFVPANKQMDLKITTPISTASGDPQVLFVHADSNSGDAAPTTCPEGEDKLAISAAVAPRMMLYSPCGLGGNISVDFSGQLYTANSGNHLVLSSFTCKPMGWLPAFGNLSCGIKGEGGALDTSKDVVSLDLLVYQTER